MQILNHAFRLYIQPDQLNPTIAFYEQLQSTACERRLSFDDLGIEVAIVGRFILLAGSDQSLAPVRDAQAVLMVDGLDDVASWLQEQGGELLHEPRSAPGGRNFTARHPDGLVVEYYEPATQQ
jgi:predicted enzyme related to lactoylglutathione lyase